MIKHTPWVRSVTMEHKEAAWLLWFEPMILASITLFQQLNPSLFLEVHTISFFIYDFLGVWKENLMLHQVVITKPTLDCLFKEQFIVKGSESETAPYPFSPFLLESSGTLFGNFYLGKMPRNLSTEWHPKPTHAGALPATKVTKTGKQLKLGLPFPGLWLSTWLRKRQTDDFVSSPSHTTTQFSFEPEVTWLCCLWPNTDVLFSVLCTLGLAWASLVETIRAPKPRSFSRDKLHAVVERRSWAV